MTSSSSSAMPPVTLQPIGIIRTPFTEKFGIPRQPRLVPEARGIIQLQGPYRRGEALNGLEDFSHLWLSWLFHQCPDEPDNFKPTVRPPRLGGNTRVGVFASRSPFRPNRLGLSALKIEQVDKHRAHIHVSGVDMVDNTPVLDIKPYIAWTDAIETTRNGFANQPPAPTLLVRFKRTALDALRRLRTNDFETCQALITSVIELNPAPGYQARSDGRTRGMALDGLNINWEIHDPDPDHNHDAHAPATAWVIKIGLHNP